MSDILKRLQEIRSKSHEQSVGMSVSDKIVVMTENEAMQMACKLSQWEELKEFAKAHEEWEGMLLNNESPWFDQMPDDIREKFDELQTLRIKAMK